MNHLPPLVLAIVIALATVSACSSEPEPTAVPPTSTATAVPPTPIPTLAPPTATSVPPTSTPEPPTSTPIPTEPPTSVKVLTDLIGRTVEIPDVPSRIVSISPTSTETLYLVGGVAIARDTSSTFPPEVEELPVLGGAYAPNMEAIAAQAPDLILIEALTQAHLVEALEEFGATVVALRAASVEDVVASIQLVGKIIEREEQASEAVSRITSEIEEAATGTANDLRVLVLISDANRLLYVAKPDSYPGAVVAAVGMSNLAVDIPSAGSLPGFTRVSAEEVIALDPDIIFTISPAPPPAPSLSSVFGIIPGFSTLTAYKSGRIYEIDPILFLRAQGPRISEAVAQLSELVEGVE